MLSRVLVAGFLVPGVLAACGDEAAQDEPSAPRVAARDERSSPRVAPERSGEAPTVPLPPPLTAERRERALDADLAGRPARAWIALLRGDERPQDGLGEDAARAALRQGGAAAVDAMLAALVEDPLQGWGMLRGTVQDLRDALVPGLLGLLSHEDPDVRAVAFRELEKLAAIGGFGVHDALVARTLLAGGLDGPEAAVLGTLGPAATPAVGDLVALLRDPDAADRALEALHGLGADAAEASGALTESVAAALAGRPEATPDADGRVQVPQWWDGAEAMGRALQTLRRIGPRAAPASSERLLGLLRAERDLTVVASLVSTLDALGAGSRAAEALLPRLAASDVRDRNAAAYGLGMLERPGEGVVTALAAAITDPDEEVASHAMQALTQAAQRDDVALGVLLRLALETPDAGHGWQSLRETVTWPNWDGAMLDPPLLRGLASKDAALRVVAIRLVPLCPLYPPYDGWAWWWVREAAKSDVASVRRAAEEVLRPFEGQAPRETSAQQWASRLATPDAAAREAALAELLASKDDVDAVVTLVVSWVRSENRNTRMAACWAISALGPRAAAALSPLVEILSDGKTPEWLLRYAGEAAGSLGAPALPALCGVVRKRGDVPELDRAFARLGEDAVPSVLAMLSDPDADVRTALVRGLRFLGGDPVVVVPRVEGMLEDPKPRVRVAASGTLIALGSRADRAVERLAEILGGELHPDDLVQRDAALELALAGSAARPALPVIVRALRSSVSCETWGACARAVAGIGPDAAEAVPALVAGLRGRVECTSESCRHWGEDSAVRIAAAQALGAMGPAAESAIPALEAAARDDDRALRRAASAALDRVREEPGGDRRSARRP